MTDESTRIIPKFRNTNRLIQWMRKNWWGYEQRLPSSHEEVFFKSKEDPVTIARNLSVYTCSYVGKIEEKFERLLLAEVRQGVLPYIKRLYHHEKPISEFLLDSIKGDSYSLYQWSSCTGKRLPKHLEDTFEEPQYAFNYSRDILKGRLPSHLEQIFFKDVHWAVKYAFDVIRGFAPCRLPEDIHSYVIMKSFEETNNSYIRAYMEACDNDPNKMGNAETDV